MSGEPPGGVMAALIVNDDPSTCDMLRLVLEDEGKFIFETAYNGQQGLTALRRLHGATRSRAR